MANKKWDIKRGYSVYKSVHTPILKKWIAEGRITKGEGLVWTSGMSGWRRPEELDEFKSLFKRQKKESGISSSRIKIKREREKPTILIIDDEKDICWLLEKYFKKRGFSAHSVNSGKEGIKAAKEKRPDVVLLDLRLEDMDGLNVLRRIKKFSKQIEVIIISAFADIPVKENAFRFGANGFVDKPFNPQDIIRSIKR